MRKMERMRHLNRWRGRGEAEDGMLAAGEPLNREHLLKQPKRKEPTLISNAPFTTSKDEEATDNSTAHSQGIRVETTGRFSLFLSILLKAFSESSIEETASPLIGYHWRRIASAWL